MPQWVFNVSGLHELPLWPLWRVRPAYFLLCSAAAYHFSLILLVGRVGIKQWKGFVSHQTVWTNGLIPRPKLELIEVNTCSELHLGRVCQVWLSSSGEPAWNTLIFSRHGRNGICSFSWVMIVAGQSEQIVWSHIGRRYSGLGHVFFPAVPIHVKSH